MPRLTVRFMLLMLCLATLVPLHAADMRILLLQAKSLNAMQRLDAIKALADIQKPQVTPVLIEAMNDPEADVAKAAIDGLGKSADVQAVDALVAVLDDKQSPLRGNALTALITMFENQRDNAAVIAKLFPVLLKVGADQTQPNWGKSRTALIKAFSRRPINSAFLDAVSTTAQEKTMAMPMRQQALFLLQCSASPRVVPLLLDLLHDPSLKQDAESGIISIMRIYNWTEHGALLDPLRAALDGTDPALRRTAIHIFGELGEAKAVDPLLRLLKNPDAQTRLDAGNALLLIGDPRSLPALCALATDADSGVRARAVGALLWAGDERSLLALAQDPESGVRDAVITALQDFHDAAALQALLNLTQDQMPEIRNHAWSALAGVQEKSVVDAALAALTDTNPQVVRHTIMRVLGMSGDPRAVDALAPFAQEKTHPCYNAAMVGLAMRGDARGITALNPPDIDPYALDDAKYSLPMSLSRNSFAVDTLVTQVQRVFAKRGKESYFDADHFLKPLAAMGPVAITRLADLLTDPNPDTRFGAAYACAVLRDVRLLPALLPLLKDPDERVQLLAANALDDMDDVRVIPAFQEAVPHVNTQIRLILLSRLNRISVEQSRESLSAMLVDPSADVKRHGLWTIGILRDPRFIPEILPLFKDQDWWVRYVAVETLDKIGSEDAMELFLDALRDSKEDVRYAAIRALAHLGTPRAISGLLTGLPQVALKDWVYSSGMLSSVKDPQLLPLLLTSAQQDHAPVVRAFALSALQNYSDPRATEAILTAATDSDMRVRGAGVKILGSIKTPAAVTTLLAALKDPEPKVCTEAATALGKIGDPQAVPALVEIVQSTNPWEIRSAAIRALSAFKDARALEPLLLATSDAEYQVKYASIQALGELQDVRAVPLLTALATPEWGSSTEAMQALAKIGDRKAMPALLKCPVNAWQYLFVEHWCNTLGSLGDPRALEPLLHLLHGKRLELRASAAEGLGRLKDPRAVPALITALDDGSYPSHGASGMPGSYMIISVNCTTRGKAAWALGEIGHREAVAPLISVLECGTTEDREQVAIALGKLKDPSAIAPLIIALSQFTGKTRTAAATSLQQLTGENFGEDAAKWQAWWRTRAK